MNTNMTSMECKVNKRVFLLFFDYNNKNNLIFFNHPYFDTLWILMIKTSGEFLHFALFHPLLFFSSSLIVHKHHLYLSTSFLLKFQTRSYKKKSMHNVDTWSGRLVMSIIKIIKKKKKIHGYKNWIVIIDCVFTFLLYY